MQTCKQHLNEDHQGVDLFTKQITDRKRKEQRRNKNIANLKWDEGNSVIVLDRTYYSQGVLKIIKLQPIKDDPILLREGQLQQLLLNLKKNGHHGSRGYKNIYPKGSKTARIQAFPKCPRIVDLTIRRHFASSCLLFELRYIPVSNCAIS